MSKLCLPNFFIVGAPKAGSTSLYYYLGEHPQIYMSPIKEPCFFATEIKPDNFIEEFRGPAQRSLQVLEEYLDGPMTDRRFSGLILERKQYLKLFRNVRDEQAIGEASVCYLWSTEAARNIREEIPGAKIIMVLRDPADRAFSQYLHAITNGLFDGSFREMLQASLTSAGSKFGILHPFLELGMYYRQVKRYQDLFPAESLKICFFEDYQRHQESFVKDIFRFLQVDPGFSPDFSKKHLQPQVARFRAIGRFLERHRLKETVRHLVPQTFRPFLRSLYYRQHRYFILEPEDRKTLIEHYSADICRLQQLVGRDLSSWMR
jgi:hypothetical protein